MDLEWNQAMSSQSSVFNKLPIHLRGEIIQIGAVKLDENGQPGEEFQIDIRPVYFRRIHYKVKKLTGFDKERLENGADFKTAFKQFREWCGEGCTFLTWGYDDQGIMEQNIIIHDLDWDWIDRWVNLQLIYNLQTDGDRNQKSLATAMEHFGIEQTRTAHDALGDAYNTAVVCSKLDLASGLEQYDRIESLLSTRLPKNSGKQDGPEPVEHSTFPGYTTKKDAISDDKVRSIPCPDCGKIMQPRKWIDQGDRRYMTLAACEDCGSFIVRLKFKKSDDESWSVNRIIYRGDETSENYYSEKLARSKRRSKRSRRKKPAAKAQKKAE
jgi:inhibitor of KinA sporulation pathway (predicted exonuclease)/predicted RNA-binding Zn-ribbon protein involved in translation (DUF1610 family)